MRDDITKNFDVIVETLRQGGLAVMKSDTIYGIFCAAMRQQAVAKLHEIRERNPAQGFIVLADSVAAVERVVGLRQAVQARLEQIWNGKNSATSVILSAKGSAFPWLADTRPDYNKTICLRVPNDEALRKLLHETGPLCAPSANLPDCLPARNIAEAKDYFGDKVRLYIDGDECDDNTPSRIIRFRKDGTVETIRSDGQNHPEDFVISRKRKLYKFAKFLDDKRCFNEEKWRKYQKKIIGSCHPGLDSGSRKTLVAEIGAGSAIFLTKLAAQNPDKTYIALDRKSDRLWQGAKLANELNLKNISFVWAEAHKLSQLLPAQSLSEIWLTFPDPFAKDNYQTARAEFAKFYHDNLRFADDRNYANNLAKYQQELRKFSAKSAEKYNEFLSADSRKRLTNTKFLETYQKLLRTDGKLNFKTDNAPLFEWSLKMFKQNGWKVELISRDLRSDPSVFDEAKIMTSYEEKFSAEGWPTYYVLCQKCN